MSTKTEQPTRSEKLHPSELWRGFWGIQVLHAGQTLGLFEPLSEPRTAAELAGLKGLEPRYVKLWCESASAYGMLQSVGDTFQAQSDLADWLQDSRGFTYSHLHLAHRANETLEAVFGGRALPEPQISLRLLLQDSLQANYRWMFQELTQELPEFQKRLLSEGRALEVGCGAGFGLGYLRDFYPKLELFGLEADYECALEAERTTKAVIHVGEEVGSRFARGFDLIVCFRTLSAAPDPAHLIAECKRLLLPDGYFVVAAETTDEGQQRKSQARIGGERLAYNILAGEYLKNSFTHNVLHKMLEEAGLEVCAQLEAPDWATPVLACRIGRNA